MEVRRIRKNFGPAGLTTVKSGGILGLLLDASVAQLVEHHVANVIVAGSIPVTRSNIYVAG